jgi:hypothetical protein
VGHPPLEVGLELGAVVIRKAKLAGLATAALAAALALPATAEARPLVTVNQSVPSQLVKQPGGSTTITITVTNAGTEAVNDEKLGLFSTRVVGERSVNNPYQSVMPSAGSCARDEAGTYQSQSCDLGPLAQGASVQIVAVVKMNEPMDHYVAADNTSFTSELFVVFDALTRVSASKGLKLSGLPTGCATHDFKLRAKAQGARSISIFADLGYDSEGDGVLIQKSKKGGRLSAKFPLTSVVAPDPTKLRTIRLNARSKDGKRLKATIKFANCSKLRHTNG